MSKPMCPTSPHRRGARRFTPMFTSSTNPLTNHKKFGKVYFFFEKHMEERKTSCIFVPE